MTFISIQQPEFFPWLGYFDKIRQVDFVVFLDNVQFKKRYFENRNQIRTYQGSTFITAPVLTKGRFTQKLNEVDLDNTRRWQKAVTASIVCNYKRAPFWNDLGDELCDLILRPYTKLLDLNLSIIKLMMFKLDLRRESCLASSLGTSASGSGLILEICQKLGAKSYLSGRDGKNYINLSDFNAEGINVVFQNFQHPTYSQFHGDFLPGMSVIDLYFNHGTYANEIFKVST